MQSVVVDMLSEWCEINQILHDEQMDSLSERSAMDAVMQVLSRVQEAWADDRMTDMLQMDVKGAFNHVSPSYLLRTIEDMDADGDLMKWMGFLMSDRRVRLVIDGHQCEEPAVDAGVSQRSPKSLMLFIVYLSQVFKEVEKAVEGYMATSFVDKCEWLVEADLEERLYKRLARAGINAAEWEDRNHVTFDNFKDEMISFT